MSDILRRLFTETWPAKAAQSALHALMLPGQVAGGELAVQPTQPGMWSDVDEAKSQANAQTMRERATDLAGLVMGGSYAAAPAMKNASGMGIRAYHGSPHDFDRFDLSKIGTGEGAQAYGHGLYFAENPKVAQMYRDQLAKGTIDFGGQRVAPAELSELLAKRGGNNSPEFLRGVMDAVHEMTATGRAPTAPADLTGWMGYGPMPQREGFAFAAGELTKAKATPGRMYEVNINAHPDQFLDWDRPLKEQPAFGTVKQVIMDAARKPAPMDGLRAYERELISGANERRPLTGQDAYAHLGRRFGTADGGVWTERNRDAASERLREAGIPGIKYLDQGSRGAPDFMVRADGDKFYVAGNGLNKYAGPFDSREAANAAREAASEQFTTRNYVVFDDKLIDILRKYGLAGASPLAALMMGGNEAQAAP